LNENIILYLDKLNPHMEKIILDLAGNDFDVRFLEPTIGKKGELKDADILIDTTFPCTKGIIDNCPKLKLIQRTGIGVDMIDMEYVTKRKIPVSVCKGFNSVSVAELVITQILALYRHLLDIDPLTKKGEWHTWTYRHDSYEISGKTVGVLGGGAIGKEVMKRIKSFDAHILYYDIFRMPEEKENELGARFVDLETIYKESDIITIHLPLMPETKGMIGNEQFKIMKKNAILINCARDFIVDQVALVEALKTGEIWGAASDIFAIDPVNEGIRSLNGVNLILTPHIGAATYDNYYRVYKFALENAAKVFSGNSPDGVINIRE